MNIRRAGLLVPVLLAASAPAAAAIPFFNATCPSGINVHADAGGPVYVDGREAALKRFNDAYYEARDAQSGLVLSISPTDSGVQVSYTGRRGANGVCTVASARADGDAGASSAARPGEPAQAVSLLCPGEGTVPAVTSEEVTDYNRDSRTSESHYETRSTDKRFHGTVEIELTPADGEYAGRIKPPRDLVPPLHAGDNRGWWSLGNVRASGDVLTADFHLNGLNRPRLRLDRRTGDLSLDGLSRFSGTCTTAGAGRLF